MDKKCIFFFSVVVACFFSCGKDNTPSQATLVGKWNLQQQHVVLTIDNIKKTDTILTASNITYATAQFNKDGTFSSASVYRPGTSPFSFPGPSSANNSGTYSYSGNVFSVVPGLAGWFVFGTGTSGPPTGVSSSIQVIQLTGSHLTIHTQDAFTLPVGLTTHTYNESFDLYYTK